MAGKNDISLLDIDRKRWMSKPYRRIPSANERIAYALSRILNFKRVGIPLSSDVQYQGRRYQLSEYIQPAVSLKSDKATGMPRLPKKGINGLLLNLLMSNIDGNWQNILVKEEDTWLVDFEYAGHFYKFEERFLERDPTTTWRLLSGFLSDSPNLDLLYLGVNRIKEVLSSNDLSHSRLVSITKEVGLFDDEAEYVTRNIIQNAESIDEKVERCLAAWQTLDFRHGRLESPKPFFPFEVTSGARCGPSCIRLALDYFGHKKPSFEQLDDEIGRHDSQYTHLVQIAAYFITHGFDVRYFINENLVRRFWNGEDKQIYHELAPKSASLVHRFTNYQATRNALKTVLESGKCSVQVPTIPFLEDIYYRDCIIICSVDNSIIYDQVNQKLRGHHVIVTGFGTNAVIYHNVGPKNAEPDVIISKEKFQRAVEKSHFVDYGMLVVLPP